MISKNELIDLRKDQYQNFLFRAENYGVSWLYYFKGQSLDQKISVLGDSDLNSNHQNSNSPELIKLFPELGPFFVFDSSLYPKTKPIPTIRDLLKASSYLFYPNDLVNYEIIHPQGNIVFSGDSPLKDIKFDPNEFNSLFTQFDHVKIYLKLLAYGLDRQDHEQESLIFESEKYKERLSKISILKSVLKQIDDPNLLSQRLKLWEADSIDNIDDRISFNKINSYERFIIFLPLSKYSNQELLKLDQFLFDEKEAEKLEHRLHIY